MRLRHCAVLFCVLTGALAGTAQCQPASAPVPLVYAAASLGTPLQQLLDSQTAPRKFEARLVLASSAQLARQIEHRAPPGIFISAHPQWMDYLAARQRLLPDTRRFFLRNRLVLAVRAEASDDRAAEPGEWSEHQLRLELARRFAPESQARLCVGDPVSVPLGMYTRAALDNLGSSAMENLSLLPAADARRTLWYLQAGACAGGILYASDLNASQQIVGLAIIPAHLHPPIVYEIALVAGAPPAARELYDFLLSPEALGFFRSRAGFL